ncbi:unnamed protein product, partial [Symbiodinium necroappetens]
CLPGDLVVCVQLMEDIMIGKHDVVLWGVVMGQATASFETRMGHASIAKVTKQAEAPVPQATPVEAPVDGSDHEAELPSAAVGGRVRERARLLAEAASSEVATFISTLVHDHQDAAKLNKVLLEHTAVQKPLSNDTRLVLHWDWAKEAEAVLLCFDSGNATSNSEMRKGKKMYETVTLHLLPSQHDLKKRANYRLAAGGSKRRRTTADNIGCLAKICGMETALFCHHPDHAPAAKMEDSSMGWLPIPLLDPENLEMVPMTFKQSVLRVPSKTSNAYEKNPLPAELDPTEEVLKEKLQGMVARMMDDPGNERFFVSNATLGIEEEHSETEDNGIGA